MLKNTIIIALMLITARLTYNTGVLTGEVIKLKQEDWNMLTVSSVWEDSLTERHTTEFVMEPGTSRVVKTQNPENILLSVKIERE